MDNIAFSLWLKEALSLWSKDALAARGDPYYEAVEACVLGVAFPRRVFHNTACLKILQAGDLLRAGAAACDKAGAYLAGIDYRRQDEADDDALDADLAALDATRAAQEVLLALLDARRALGAALLPMRLAHDPALK
jgi:hypothetical protein